MTELLAIFVIISFAAYSLFSKAISKTIVTLPMIFAFAGYLMAGPVQQAVPNEFMHEGSRLLAEITLILVLFSDASHVRFSSLSSNWKLPSRMLVIGMPLTLLLGMLVAYAINPASGIAMALLTAAVLTPTDAALGQSVVSNPAVPTRLGQTINVESGLNDGLALPFVLLGALLASKVGSDDVGTISLLYEAAWEIFFGPVAGIIVGGSAAMLLNFAHSKNFTNEASAGITFLCSAFAAYLLALLIHGNGFIAAFVAGMTFGNVYRYSVHFIGEFMEGIGQLLTMAAFLVFGAVLLPEGLAHANYKAVLVGILFLTVVRMLPIFLSLLGSGLPVREKLFLGWFGPRGLASVLFTLIIVDEFEFAGEQELLACVSMTVTMSIMFHGLSATPLSNHFRDAKDKISD